MNPEMNRDQMHQDQLDTILAREDEIIPSSGFLSRVMDKVQEEAAAPPPIPFPWKRAIPGFILVAAVFGWGAVETVRHATEAGAFALPNLHLATSITEQIQQAGWVVGALAISAVSWLLSRRLAGRSGLF
jgi:hypothetical protein